MLVDVAKQPEHDELLGRHGWRLGEHHSALHQQESQGGTVGTIKQETRGGKTFYVAEITDQKGKKKHVRVNQDGSLMTGRSAKRHDGNSKASPDTTPSTTK